MTTSTIAPETVARRRALEKLRPGYWWQGDFGDGLIWVCVDLIIESEQILTGKRIIRVFGTDPTVPWNERNVQHINLRGSSVLSVTERQAKRCGLTVDAAVTP